MADRERNLNQLSSEELGALFPIIISDPNPNWCKLFQVEKEKICKVLSKNIVRMEHIGSTAVPHLKSKPTIDILLEICDDSNLYDVVRCFKNLGYYFISKPENPPPHMMFVKGYSKEGFVGQAYHIHVRYKGDWDEILFRNYLISHPKVANEYADLKAKLAARFRNDRDAYTDAKSDFIKKIILLARKDD